MVATEQGSEGFRGTSGYHQTTIAKHLTLHHGTESMITMISRLQRLSDFHTPKTPALLRRTCARM